MTKFLPPHLLDLFAPRAPLEYRKPLPQRKFPRYSGVSSFVDQLEQDPDNVDRFVELASFQCCCLSRASAAATNGSYSSQFTYVEKTKERHERKRKAAEMENKRHIKKEVKSWDPKTDPAATSDAYKTIVVANLPYETHKDELRDLFAPYGNIVMVRIVVDKEGKSRGYGFIEFELENSIRAALREMDGHKIDNRRIKVDVERGRTVPDWLPRRLGGGRGVSRPDRQPGYGSKKYLRQQEALRRQGAGGGRPMGMGGGGGRFGGGRGDGGGGGGRFGGGGGGRFGGGGGGGGGRFGGGRRY